MLNELALHIDERKARDILNRLEKNKVDQALPAEMELAVLWALSRIGKLEVEPDWWDDEKRPDAYTEHLIIGEPAAIEIAVHSDNSISGEQAMDGVAIRIGEFASSLEKGLGDHLHYFFAEESGYNSGSYFRRRLAPINYKLSDNARSRIESWVTAGAPVGSKIHLVEPDLNVQIERTSRRQIRWHNAWSTMPPEAHSVENNPLYELLRRKLKQLKAARPGTHRFIFICEAGSSLLNKIGGIGEYDPTHRRVSGNQIISHFVQTNAHAVDAVVVIAAVRKNAMLIRDTLQWKVTAFNRPSYEFDLARLAAFAEHLPRPRFEGYETRSLFRQGAYSPHTSRWYLGLNMRGSIGGPMEVRISSRVLLDFLADRMSAEQFRQELGQLPGEKNPFKHWLDSGHTVQDMKFESGGIDQEDDRIVLTFAADPSVRALDLPETVKSEQSSD